MVEADERLEAGDIAAGVELENRLWVDRAYPEMVDPVWERVRVMNTANYQRAADESIELDLEPAAIDRLAEIGVPTLIVAGYQDVSDILAIAELLQKDIGGARLAIIPNTAHQLNMERPDEFNRIVLDFLRASSS
jgi:pimeloyl-ACP methyl ester carboxylesterase